MICQTNKGRLLKKAESLKIPGVKGKYSHASGGVLLIAEEAHNQSSNWCQQKIVPRKACYFLQKTPQKQGLEIQKKITIYSLRQQNIKGHTHTEQSQSGESSSTAGCRRIMNEEAKSYISLRDTKENTAVAFCVPLIPLVNICLTS